LQYLIQHSDLSGNCTIDSVVADITCQNETQLISMYSIFFYSKSGFSNVQFNIDCGTQNESIDGEKMGKFCYSPQLTD
jgi:hypothetical protein